MSYSSSPPRSPRSSSESLRALELSQGAQRARKSPPRATRFASSSTNNTSEAVPLTRSYGRDRRESNASASTIFGGAAGNRPHHTSGSVGGGSSISGRANGLGHGGRQRMLSIVGTPTSLMFDLTNDVIPISLSEDTSAQNRAPAAKTIGLVNGIALVVGNQIGSGIFSSPGVVLADSGSVGASLMVWVVSGVLAWTGASSFAELGSAIPLSGGAQAYLAYAYNPMVSYLFSWTAIAVLKPGSNAIISSILGEYLNRLFFHATAADASPDSIPQWAIKFTACIAVIIVSILCVATPKLATRVAVLFTSAKIAVLIAVTVMGLLQLGRGKASTAFREPLFEGTSPNPSAFALALFSGLWAYEGWDQANYITGEMKDPAKNMPRVIHSSMTTVTLLFLLANISYFIVLDKSIVSRSNTIALDFGRALFGPVGAIVFACLVAVSCFGALNGAFFTSSRLICAAGQEGFLPEMFGQLHPTRHTPMNATILQAVVTLGFVIFGGGFRSLVNFYSVASWGFYFLTVLGLVVLRFKEPYLERPYRTFISTPLIFCGVALFLLSMPVLAAPLEALAALGFILAGIPMYFLTQSEYANRPDSLLGRFKAWVNSLYSDGRLSRGGWTRVATEADPDELEMHTAPR